MCIYFVRKMRRNQCTRAGFWGVHCPRPEARRAECIGQASKSSACALNLSHFSNKINANLLTYFIHVWKKGKYFAYVREKVFKIIWKYYPALTMKIRLPSEKMDRSNHPLYARVGTKSMARSPRRSTRSALSIFNQLRVLSVSAFWLARKKSECMNDLLSMSQTWQSSNVTNLAVRLRRYSKR